MRYCAALVFSGLVLNGQTLLPVPIGPIPTLSQPAVDNRGISALISTSVSPEGQINSGSDLYLLSTDGAAVRKLTNLTNSAASWIDLSPDGSKAVYNVSTATTLNSEEIHVLDIGSGAEQKITVDTSRCILPLAICYGCVFSCVRSVRFSPDATKVVFSESQSQPLWTANADGSGMVHLPMSGAGLASSPQRVVSRNGLLVFTAAGQFTEDVYVSNLDGSGMRNLTNFSAGHYALNAVISEDGATIAFQMQPAVSVNSGTSSGTPANSQIYILHMDGAPPRQLTNTPLDSSVPSISADGSLVAYIRAGQAVLQPTDGSGAPAQLTNFTYVAATGVTLSGDGSTALISTGTAIYRVVSGMKPNRVYGPRTVLPNGISSLSGISPLSPGSLFRISGWNFADDAEVDATSLPLPQTLGGISVNWNGQPIPLLSINPTQITAQLPFTASAVDATQFLVSFDGGGQVSASAAVKDAAPEILRYPVAYVNTNLAMAFHAGTNIPADQGHPAVAGETLETYGIGLGAVSPAVDAGSPGPADPPAGAVAVPQVKIGNQNAKVSFAGLAPGLVGIDQVNIVVPSGLKSGLQTLSWLANGQSQVAYNIYVK
jgi:uncharacterized protein (TIGR03437 family)